MKEVVWNFIYTKATTLKENYRAAYELWRKRNTDLGTNRGKIIQLKRKIIP
jgi:hypothetical protein